MGVSRVSVSLSSSRPDGHNIAAEDFTALLSAATGDAIEGSFSDLGRWATSTVDFRPVLLSDFAGAEEPSIAFDAATQGRLQEVAEFLDRQSPSTFAQFRERGLRVSLYIEVRMSQDQMQLALPAHLLSSCARLDLGIELISNDISAAEAVAAGWV